MRLADRIRERAADPGGHPMALDWRRLSGVVSASDCYVLDRAVGEMAMATLEQSPAGAIARVLPGLAFPSPFCWFEWQGPSANMGPRADQAVQPGKVVPDRCGVLVETLPPEHRRGAMTFVWHTDGHEIEVCPFTITFDLRQDSEPVPDIRRASFAMNGRDWRAETRRFHERSRFRNQPLGTFMAMEERFGHLPCPHLEAFWTMMDARVAADPNFGASVVVNALSDVEGEPTFVLGVLMCLCAEGLLHVSAPEELGKLNAARIKRRRMPLLPFRTMSVSGRNVIRLSGRGGAVEAATGFHAA